MASNGHDDLIRLLCLERENFWLGNSHLHPSETQMLWNQRVASLTSALGTSESISNPTSQTQATNLPRKDPPQSENMARRRTVRGDSFLAMISAD